MNTKTDVISLRLNDKLRELINEEAAKRNQTVSEFLRACAIKEVLNVTDRPKKGK